MGCDSSSPTTTPARRAGGAQKEKVTFGYWNLRGSGRGNPARYLLNYAKVQYDEKTYIIGEDEWKNSKGNLGMDFPNLPYLICDDFKISETLAVHQYIAAKFCPEILGKTAEDRANNYRLQLIANEKMVEALMTVFTQDDKSVTIAKFMENMRGLVDHLGNKNFLSNAKIPCIADFILFEFMEFAQKVSGNAVYGTHPTLEAFHGRMSNLPGLKEYLASERHITTPYVPGFAKVQF